MDERDRRYEERDEARKSNLEIALAAANDQISAVKQHTDTLFAASEKAILKAEAAQQDYNVRSNEFRAQLDDQAKRLIGRTEVDGIIKNLDEKIQRIDADLRLLQQARSGEGGTAQGGKAVRDDARANLAIVVAFIGVILVVIQMLVRK